MWVVRVSCGVVRVLTSGSDPLEPPGLLVADIRLVTPTISPITATVTIAPGVVQRELVSRRALSPNVIEQARREFTYNPVLIFFKIIKLCRPGSSFHLKAGKAGICQWRTESRNR